MHCLEVVHLVPLLVSVLGPDLVVGDVLVRDEEISQPLLVRDHRGRPVEGAAADAAVAASDRGDWPAWFGDRRTVGHGHLAEHLRASSGIVDADPPDRTVLPADVCDVPPHVGPDGPVPHVGDQPQRFEPGWLVAQVEARTPVSAYVVGGAVLAVRVWDSAVRLTGAVLDERGGPIRDGAERDAALAAALQQVWGPWIYG